MAAVAVIACNAAGPRFAFKHAERRGRLDANGLKFVVMPDATTQLVEVDVRYDVGAREDPPGKAGLAHLVEHLMFQLRPDVDSMGAGAPPLMTSIHQLTTFFNAATDWDYTHYMNRARAEQMDALVKIEAMRLHFGCKTISQAEFLREREVVRNEIRQRAGTAEGQIPQLVLSSIYPKGHAYERMVGGDGKDKLDRFRKAHYTAGNATLVVVGDFDPAEARRPIRHHHSDWSKGRVDQPVGPSTARRTGPAHIGVVGKEGPQLAFRIAHPAPGGVDGQESARQILAGESTVTAELAQRLGFIAQHGLDADHNNRLLQMVGLASTAQIRALRKTELDPANEVVVVLGDRAHLERTFRDAGLNDVKIVEPEFK